MAGTPAPSPGNFQQIKAQLEPRCTYLIFERTSTGAGESAFPEVGKLLDPYRSRILEQSLYYDDAAGRLFMVVKLQAREMLDIESIVVHPGLPRDVVVYFYGNPPSRREPA